VSALAAALRCAERGWPVFPVHSLRDGRCSCGGTPCKKQSPGKHPRISEWEKRAIVDLDRIRQAWTGPYAGSNVGIHCGAAGLVVIDLDRDKPLPEPWNTMPGIVDGADVFAALCERHNGGRLPWTHVVATPSGGQHWYYRASPGTAIGPSGGRVGPMIDVRAGNGYVLAAGSTLNGVSYETLDDREPLPLPAWLARLASEPTSSRPQLAVPAERVTPRGALVGIVRFVLESAEGERNNRLHWAACRAAQDVAAGRYDESHARAALLQAAIDVGLGESEACRTILSGLRTRRVTAT